MHVKQSALYTDETTFREFTRARENSQKSKVARVIAHANRASENAIAITAEPFARASAQDPREILFDMKLSNDCIKVLEPTLNTIGFKVELKDIQDSGLNDYYFTLVSNNGIKRLLLQIKPIFLSNSSPLNQLALTWVKDSFKLANEFIPPINMFIFYQQKPADAFINLTRQWTIHDDDYDIKLINVQRILNLKEQDQGYCKNELKKILGLDIPRKVIYLSNDKIIKLTEAILSGGLNTLDDREMLLEGIYPGYVARLPLRRSPIDQIESDLRNMNRVPWLTNYEVPLKIWLKNAVHRLESSGREIELAMFQKALDDVKTKSEEIIREARGTGTTPG